MRSTLTTIIIIGMLLGIAVGYACHTLWPDPAVAKSISEYISLMTDIFLRLIKMIIAEPGSARVHQVRRRQRQKNSENTTICRISLFAIASTGESKSSRTWSFRSRATS